MKTMFTVDNFSKDMWRGPSLGDPLTAAEIDDLMSKITAGRQRLAQVRQWIASKIDADPLLARTFNDPVVQRNFWDYLDLVNTDQSYVDRTWEALQNPVSADYDIPNENVQRTDDWSKAVDILYGAMREYGNVQTTTPIGTTPVKPAAKAPEAKILGVPQNAVILGGGILAAGLLIALLK